MHVLINKKAMSTLILIILLLCSMIFGALISYLWVMGNYYNMPENTTMLIVTDAAFPVNNATYFNVTILNPSNSISDVNITAIRLSVEEKNETYKIITTEPSGQIPFLIRRGTRQSFKCITNWSNVAGETVKIEPVAANVSTKSYSYTTPNVKLKLTPNFDVTKSVEYFNLTIENSAELDMNLTISQVTIFDSAINTTPTLPFVLSPNQTETFRCGRNWEDLMGVNATIKVRTEEGYESVYTTKELLGAVLYVSEIKFDYEDTSYFNLTISNSEQSTANATLDKVNLTLADNTTITLNTSPPLDLIPMNQSLTIQCYWDWSQRRNETITVSVHTKEGFTVPTKTESTPAAVVWNITDVKFDLYYTDYFLVNVTNMPCSLNEINVTGILLDGNATVMDPSYAVLTNGTHPVSFNCSLPWGSLIGKNANITVLIEDGSNISRVVAISSVGLKLQGDDKLIYGDLIDQNTTISIPYVNITISNSINSLQNVNITKIVFEALNKTYEIDGSLTHPELIPSGYNLAIGENLTIVCPWNRFLYAPEPLTEIIVTVYTAEGFQVSKIYYT